ncbi:nodulin-related protein 1-like [Apium graveolens]|uniref:nodulin-related protein 1-like n=1 Tax=Apium graveolens TaxID=4045 RepID=UPI003D7A755B
MDALFGGHDKKSDSPSHTEGSKKTEGGADHPKPSKGELLASAMVIKDAAFGGGKDKNVDKAKVAGAAEDLLQAAEEYGKLGETGYGKYVDKAEEYLHKYRETTGHDPPKTGDVKPAAGSGKEHEKESKSDDKHEGGGMGDVMKMAGGFFK